MLRALPASDLERLLSQMLGQLPCTVTARKDDAPAVYQAAITNLADLAPFSGGGGLIQTTSVTARKDDAPAADQAAITNLADLAPFSGGGGLIQTTSG
jgi:hypothetical protein